MLEKSSHDFKDVLSFFVNAAGARLFEPRHENSNNVVCATSKASYQPAQTRSLIGAFACRMQIL